MRFGSHRCQYVGQSRNELLSVRLVDLILHCAEDQIWVWWRVTKGCCKKSEPLKIEDLEIVSRKT